MINFYEWNRTFRKTKEADSSASPNHKDILVNGNQLRYYQQIKTKRLPPKRAVDAGHNVFRTIDDYQYDHNFFMNSAIKSKLKPNKKTNVPQSHPHHIKSQSKDKQISLHEYLVTRMKTEGDEGQCEAPSQQKEQNGQNKLKKRYESSWQTKSQRQNKSREGIHLLTQNQRNSYRKYKFQNEKRYKTLPTNRSSPSRQPTPPPKNSRPAKLTVRMISFDQIFQLNLSPTSVGPKQEAKCETSQIKVYQSYKQLQSNAQKNKKTERFQFLSPNKRKSTMILPWSQEEQDQQKQK